MLWVKLICTELNKIGLTTAFKNQKPVTDNGKLIPSFNQIIQRIKIQMFFLYPIKKHLHRCCH